MNVPKDDTNKDRTVQLLMMLVNARFPISHDYLCRELNISKRTLMRHIEAFRKCGFIITGRNKEFFLEKKTDVYRDLEDLLYFDQEEAELLYRAIDSIPSGTVRREELKKKLGTLYSVQMVRDRIMKLQRPEKRETAMIAIDKQCCVKIIGYSSAHSHSVSDRIVEPFAMGPENKMVWCYEPESGRNKVFVFARMSGLELLENQPWQHAEEHQQKFTDAFHMFSEDGTTRTVELKLNRRAMNLMVDEYPLTKRDIFQVSDEEWSYRGRVSNYIGIGRFVLGLADNIKVETTAFRIYLRKFATFHLSYPEVDRLMHKDVIW